MSIITVREYNDDNDNTGRLVGEFSTEKEARRAAARSLGHRTLRGAASWARYQGGVAWQFGKRDECQSNSFVVIETI